MRSSNDGAHLNTYLKERFSKTELGLSLVELLIAMTLGVLLIAGMVAVFAGNKRSSELNSAMAEIQENARFALNTIASELRMSGFQGCLDLNFVSANLLGKDLPTADYQNTATMGSIISSGNQWSPAPPPGFQKDNHVALAGTHALTVQFGSPASYPLAETVNTDGVPDTAGSIIVNTSAGISREEFNLTAGDYGIISDCTGADIIKISKVSKEGNTATIEHSASVNHSGSLSRIYTTEANKSSKFMRFISNVYYVADTGLKNKSGDAITALYRQALPYGDTTNNPPTELVRGVENMRLAFGIRTSGNSLTYVLASDSAYDPAKVESIRIGLLFSSFDRLAEANDSKSYILAGQVIEPQTGATSTGNTYKGDKRLRLAFNTTVKLRNRRTHGHE